MRKQPYWKGFKAEYTGNSNMLYGGNFWEIRILEGPHSGELKWTHHAPEFWD